MEKEINIKGYVTEQELSDDLKEKLKKIDTIKMSAKDIPLADDENNFKNDNVEEALSECIKIAKEAKINSEKAFQEADNGKKLIADAIGSPLSATDDFNDMNRHFQQMIINMVNFLKSKNVLASYNDKLYELISRLNYIKSYVSGDRITRDKINIEYDYSDSKIFSEFKLENNTFKDIPIYSIICTDSDIYYTYEKSMNYNLFISINAMSLYNNENKIEKVLNISDYRNFKLASYNNEVYSASYKNTSTLVGHNDSMYSLMKINNDLSIVPLASYNSSEDEIEYPYTLDDVYCKVSDKYIVYVSCYTKSSSPDINVIRIIDKKSLKTIDKFKLQEKKVECIFKDNIILQDTEYIKVSAYNINTKQTKNILNYEEDIEPSTNIGIACDDTNMFISYNKRGSNTISKFDINLNRLKYIFSYKTVMNCFILNKMLILISTNEIYVYDNDLTKFNILHYSFKGNPYQIKYCYNKNEAFIINDSYNFTHLINYCPIKSITLK